MSGKGFIFQIQGLSGRYIWVEIFVLIYFGWDIWVNVHEDNMNIQISSQPFAKQSEENPNQGFLFRT